MQKVILFLICSILFISHTYAGYKDSVYTDINLYSTALIGSQDIPALTGIEKRPVIYFNQSTNFMAEKPSINNLHGSLSFNAGKWGFGKYFSYNYNGVVAQTGFGLSASYCFSIKNLKIRLGTSIQANNYTEHISANEVFFTPDPIVYSRKPFLNFTNSISGLFLEYKKIYFGISKGYQFDLHEYKGPQIRDLNTVIKPFLYQAYAGYCFKLNKFNVQPVVRFIKDNYNIHFTPAVMVDYKNSYLLGISYNYSNAIAIHGGVLLKKRLRMISSLTIPVSKREYYIREITHWNAGIRFQL